MRRTPQKLQFNKQVSCYSSVSYSWHVAIRYTCNLQSSLKPTIIYRTILFNQFAHPEMIFLGDKISPDKTVFNTIVSGDINQVNKYALFEKKQQVLDVHDLVYRQKNLALNHKTNMCLTEESPLEQNIPGLFPLNIPDIKR